MRSRSVEASSQRAMPWSGCGTDPFLQLPGLQKYVVHQKAIDVDVDIRLN